MSSAGATISPEGLVRAALAALEADFRRISLLAMADWARCGIASTDLFNAVAALQRPSWGTWNGLLGALRSARRSALRSGSADERRRLESAVLLDRVMALLDERADPILVASLSALGELTRIQLSGRVKLGVILTMPIALRNRMCPDGSGVVGRGCRGGAASGRLPHRSQPSARADGNA
jgi:hypothetical protein